MKLGDRVRLTKSTLDDGSDQAYVGRIGIVVAIKPEVPRLVGVKIDGDDKLYHALPIADLEKVEV